MRIYSTPRVASRNMAERAVSFSSEIHVASACSEESDSSEESGCSEESDVPEYVESFSEGECWQGWSSSDDDHAEFLEHLLGVNLPTSQCDPVNRSSLLLFGEEEDIEDSSVYSEISLCLGGSFCGTSQSEEESESEYCKQYPRKRKRQNDSDSSESESDSSKRTLGASRGTKQGRGHGVSGRGETSKGSRTSRGRGRGRGTKRGRGRGMRRGRGRGTRRGSGREAKQRSSANAGEKEGIKWKIYDTQTSADAQPPPRVLQPFEYSSGPTPRTKSAKSPIEIFQLFLTVVVLESIVGQTLLIARSKNAAFNEFYLQELQAINIAMGMLRLPQVKDYWCSNEVIATPWFAAIMPRDRFFAIMRHLHLVDSSKQKKIGEPGYDPLYKVRPLVDHFSAVFASYYQPAREISIDEMMIGTRCRVSFLQYLPKKPCKFGVKVWVLAEAKTGYVLCFQVYTGASAGVDTTKGLAYRVVMDLIESYQGKGHRLFMDNFYTSPQLLSDLLKKGIYSTGTVRTNRKDFPENLKLDKSKALEMGTFRFATCEDLTAVVWRDRRDVYVLSSMHNRSVQTVNKRPKGAHEKVPVPCPTAIYDYNQYMGGVDLADQQISYYSLTQRRTIKWWQKVFWRLIDIAIINSWIIFHTNTLHSRIKTQREFRLKLVAQLVQPLLDLRASPQCPAILLSHKGRKPRSSDNRLNGKHFAYKAEKRDRCVVCSKKRSTRGQRIDTKTKNFCPKCNIFACLGKCFENYHTKSQY